MSEGRVSVAAGAVNADDSTERVTFTSDRETAWQVAVEGYSAQRAVLHGRMRLDGDVRLLLAARPALDAIGTALTAAT